MSKMAVSGRALLRGLTQFARRRPNLARKLLI